MSGWHWHVIAFLSLLVPAGRRVEWRREWKGELLHLEQRLRARPDSRSTPWRLLLRSLGAVTDASYLRLTAWIRWELPGVPFRVAEAFLLMAAGYGSGRVSEPLGLNQDLMTFGTVFVVGALVRAASRRLLNTPIAQ